MPIDDCETPSAALSIAFDGMFEPHESFESVKEIPFSGATEPIAKLPKSYLGLLSLVKTT